jgi:hypothetical protein
MRPIALLPLHFTIGRAGLSLDNDGTFGSFRNHRLTSFVKARRERVLVRGSSAAA